MSVSLRPWDAGLQNERTSLAWLRTSLSLLGCAALVAERSGSVLPAVVVLGGSSLAAGAAMRAGSRRTGEQTDRLHRGEPPSLSTGRLLGLSCATGAMSVIALLVVLG